MVLLTNLDEVEMMDVEWEPSEDVAFRQDVLWDADVIVRSARCRRDSLISLDARCPGSLPAQTQGGRPRGESEMGCVIGGQSVLTGSLCPFIWVDVGVSCRVLLLRNLIGWIDYVPQRYPPPFSPPSPPFHFHQCVPGYIPISHDSNDNKSLSFSAISGSIPKRFATAIHYPFKKKKTKQFTVSVKKNAQKNPTHIHSITRKKTRKKY